MIPAAAAEPRPPRRGLLFAGIVGAVAVVGGAGALALSFGGSGGDAPALVILTPSGFDAGDLPSDSPARVNPVRDLRASAAHTTYVVGDPGGDLLFFDSHAMSGTNMAAVPASSFR